MKPHPDFADVELPRVFDLGRFRLTPLTPAELDEDFAAVTDSADLLKGLFGDWPEGLTREADLADLAWHDREFDLRRSFSWIVRDGAGGYLGCAYLFPDLGTRGQAAVATWIRRMPGRDEAAAELNAALADWLAARLPAGIALRWTSSPALPG